MTAMSTEGLQHVGSMVKDLPMFQVVDVQEVWCVEHGDYKQTTYATGRKTRCPICEAENEAKRKVNEEQERQKAAQERNARFVDELMGESGLAPRFQGKMIRDYVTETRQQEEVVAFLKAYAAEFTPKHSGRSLALIGNPGTGKTHLASAIVGHCIRNLHRPARFMNISKLNRLIRESKSFDAEHSESEVISALATCELLVIDEVGVQSGTDAESRALFDVFNARYEAMKPTIFISNLGLQDFADAVGARIMSRLREDGGAVLSFDWSDYRK